MADKAKKEVRTFESKLAALVDGQVVGTMGVGKIVGEVAFFAGGIRMANVEGAEAGFIAFMTNNEIQNLCALRRLGRATFSDARLPSRCR